MSSTESKEDQKPVKVADSRDLTRLARWTDGLVISAYLSTDRATFKKEQNSLRLNVLLQQARSLLQGHGLTRGEADDFLRPATALVDDGIFWKRQLDGLAVFVRDGECRHIHLPFPVDELVMVGQAAEIRPLLRILSMEGRFYVLAISRNEVRLLRSTLERAERVDLTTLGVSTSLSEELRFDDFSRSMQSHASTRADPVQQTHSQATARSGRHIWHGHGGGDDDVKDHVKRYLKSLDRGLSKLLARERAPLILAGVGSEVDMFRSISSYDHLLPEGVDGAPDRMSDENLIDRARPVAQGLFDARVTEALAEFVEAGATDLVTTDLADILGHAYRGRVDLLLVRGGPAILGTYDPADGSMLVHDDAGPGDVDLLDLAARETLRHGGRAHLVEPGDMPDGSDAAAIRRF